MVRAIVDKCAVCGIDISAKELVVIVERQGRRASPRSFPNTPRNKAALHAAALRFRPIVGVPDAASRVCDERQQRAALTPLPASKEKCALTTPTALETE